VGLLRNPPRCPQANGVVERSQGTGKRWAEPRACLTAVELQARVTEEDRLQRQVYPCREGRSRWELYPDLVHSGHGYSVGGEPLLWDLGLVLRLLSACRLGRKVSADGKVSLYDRGYSVGRQYQGEVLEVGFDAWSREWIFRQEGQEVRRHEAIEVEAERIMALSISRER
jgi:hypothetical protein